MPRCYLSIIQRAALGAFEALTVPKGISVLNAPCGDGSLAATLRRAGYDAHGVDIDRTGAALLGSAYHDANLNDRLPFPDASFDVVLSIEGIEHLEDRFAYLRALQRVLKPQGTLILTTPNIVGLRSRVRFSAAASTIATADPCVKQNGIRFITSRSARLRICAMHCTRPASG